MLYVASASHATVLVVGLAERVKYGPEQSKVVILPSAGSDSPQAELYAVTKYV